MRKKKAPRRIEWAEGPVEHYCHQCRTKTFRLFMDCASEGCNMKYCVKCVNTRYPTVLSFDETRDDFYCFRCTDTCNCDICCGKRGETYISSRGPSKLTTTFKPAHLVSCRSGKIMTSTKLPPLTVDTQISQPMVYWGAIYNCGGEVIAKGYVTSAGDDDVIFARPLPPKSRVFIGEVQADWGLGS
ncbi:hypothetical protein J3R30DRAFT_3304174, partial [Lentinula aciculospora]